MTRVLVTGGRRYDDAVQVDLVLNRIHMEMTISTIIHGNAGGHDVVCVDDDPLSRPRGTKYLYGADVLAGHWAMQYGIPQLRFPVTQADWRKYGNAAGPRRNRKMLLSSKPDVLVAFPGGTGTANCVKQALLFYPKIVNYQLT